MSVFRHIMFLIIILAFSSIAVAQDICETVIQTSLASLSDECDDIEANSACYVEGVSFVGRDGMPLSEQIVVVSAIQTISTGLSDTWGIAKINLQANLAEDSVTMLLFGDAILTNATPAVTNLPATVTSNGRMRSTPSSANDTNILVGVPQGSTVYAGGRNQGGDWLYVTFTDATTNGLFTGWISNQVLRFDEDRMTLDVVDGTQPIYAPMQAFSLTTGDSFDCEGAISSGLLIQTPDDTHAELVVNGVKIMLSGSAYLQTSDGALLVNVLEGSAVTQARTQSQFIPAGTLSTIFLADEGNAPSQAPSVPAPYADNVATLSQIGIQTTIAPPLPEDAIADVIQEQFAPYGALDGIYIFYFTSLRTISISYGDDWCGESAYRQVGGVVRGVPPVFRLIFTDGNMNTLHSWLATAPNPNGFNFSQVAPGVYGASEGAHSAVAPPSSSTGMGATGVETFYIESPTSVRWRATLGTSDGQTYSNACEIVARGIWQRPLNP